MEKPIAESIGLNKEVEKEAGNWEDAEEEGRKIKGQENLAAPSQAEF